MTKFESEMPNATPQAPTTLDPVAWQSVLDALLHGITHRLNNRLTVLSGVSDILSQNPSDSPSDKTMIEALCQEVARLDDAIRLLRLLNAPATEGDEATDMNRVIEDALTLLRCHPTCGRVPITVTTNGDVPPVVVRPSVLLRELLVLFAKAGEAETAAREMEQGGTIGGTTGGETGQVAVTWTAADTLVHVTAGSSTVSAPRLLRRR